VLIKKHIMQFLTINERINAIAASRTNGLAESDPVNDSDA